MSNSDQQRSENITSEENRPTDDYEEINDDVVIRLERIRCDVPESYDEIHGGTSYQKLLLTMEERCYTPLEHALAIVVETGPTSSASEELM